MYYLTILSGEREGESIKLEEGETSIGRSSKCTIKVSDDTDISREHVRLTMKQGTVMAEDLGSTHGTRLNEGLLQGTVSLTLGDVLQVGSTLLRLDLPTVGVGGPASSATLPESPPSGEATKFADDEPASADGGPATQFDSQVVHLLEEEMGGATRVFQEDATRMMDESEMREVRPGQGKKGSKISPIVGMVLTLVIVVLVLAIFGGKEDAPSGPTYHQYVNGDFGLRLQYPDHWPSEPGDGNVRAIMKMPEAKGQVTITAERNDSFRFMLQSEAMKAYVKAQAAIRKDFYLTFQQDYRATGADAVTYYTFRAESEQGSGYFFLNGDQQVVIEGSAPKAGWPAVSTQVDSMLESLSLDPPQRRLVYPLPNAKLKAQALVDPGAVRAQAEALLSHGDELIKNRDVAYGNLYYGMKKYEECLTLITALAVRPPLYKEAALKLTKARADLRALIANQDSLVIQAMSIRDWNTMCNECQIMLQIIPDAMHPDHQRAMGVIKYDCQ